MFPHMGNIPPRNEIDALVVLFEEFCVLMEGGYLFGGEVGLEAVGQLMPGIGFVGHTRGRHRAGSRRFLLRSGGGL